MRDLCYKRVIAQTVGKVMRDLYYKKVHSTNRRQSDERFML